MQYLFFGKLGKVKFSLDKYIMAINLSPGKYNFLRLPHPWSYYIKKNNDEADQTV